VIPSARELAVAAFAAALVVIGVITAGLVLYLVGAAL
jgi:hypothetical protein